MSSSKFERLRFQRKQAEMRQFNVQTELAELVESVVNFPEKAILEQVREIEETKHLFALVDEIDLESQGIDLRITCAKSGNFIHQYTIHDYLTLREIHGEERALEIMQTRQFSAISPLWLYTDNKALDNLQIADPYGYCVFALSKLLWPRELYGKAENTLPFHIRADWHKQKADAFEAARKLPLTGLVELNETMRRFLAVVMPGKAKVKFTANRLDEALENWRELMQEIRENLETILLREMKRGRMSEYVSYSDIVELQHIYQGYGNFAAQRKPREKTQTEQIQDIINDAFADSQIPRYLAGHEPKFEPQQAKRGATYSAGDLDKIIDSAMHELDAQTKGEKPMEQKLTFAQLLALKKKG